MAVAAAIALVIVPAGYQAVYPGNIGLTRIDAVSARALARLFVHKDYHWPPSGRIPRLAVESLPAGLGNLEIAHKKSVFLRSLLPIVLAEEIRIRRQRRFLQNAFDQGTVDEQSDKGRTVTSLAAAYRISGNVNDPAVRRTLLLRVDTIPVALVLAQAAQESGWGTSRFAVEGNNLFGVWTYHQDEGLIPQNRANDAQHLVRTFPDLRASVRDYLHNINIGHAYTAFRRRRAAMRANARPLDAVQLAESLNGYSQRGEAYVRDIQAMIRINKLEVANDTVLAPLQ